MVVTAHMRVLLIAALAVFTLTACSDSSDRFEPATRYVPIPVAALEAPPDVGEPFVQTVSFNLAEVGYESEEFFVRGTASSFITVTEAGADGVWDVETFDSADYLTRIVVHRPANSGDFSGTVIVEWLNVSGGLDAGPGYVAGHTEIHRSGHAWVGVSAQVVGIEGQAGGFPLNLKAVNPARYGELVHPGDQYSYDIFAQVAGLLREPGAVDPLGGLQPAYIWALGESQSAFRLTTFINALQLYYNPFDGYHLYSRGGSGSPLQPGGGGIDPTGAQRIREDVNVPVLTFQAETDLLGLGYLPARQEDSAHFRLWEVAGTAHADVYTVITGAGDIRGAPEFAEIAEISELAGYIECEKPFNAGPMHYVINASLRALDDWVRTGTPPPSAPPLEVSDDGSDLLRDEFGNATGGIRTPHVDAPAATLRGDGNAGGGFCFLFGTTELFSPALMASLYVDAAGYTEAVRKAAEDAVGRGHLLPEDADAIISWAPRQWARQVVEGRQDRVN
jgi:hypothetical protein